MTEKQAPSKYSRIQIIIAVALALFVGYSTAYLAGFITRDTSEKTASKAGSDQGHEHDTESEIKQLYTCGMHPWIVSEEPGLCPICNMDLTPMKSTSSDDEGSQERKILYYRAPMNPMEIYDKPGKSNMGMDLVPVYEDEVVSGVTVKIDPVTQQNMGIRTQLVRKDILARTLRTYGHITYDETKTSQINPKFSGWIEKVHVGFTGQQVEKGQALFDVYAPELLTAQEEYLAAYQMLSGLPGTDNQSLLNSARKRLLYFDVPLERIKQIEQTGKVGKTVTISSPYRGVVITNNAVAGTLIKPGAPVYVIADLKGIWVEAHIFEYELPWVKVGQETEMTLPYQPGEIYRGSITYIYPYLQKKTRDVVLRLEFDNPQKVLKPDMYADVRIKVGTMGTGLIIPSEAVIRSGERNLVFVTRGDGKFTPRDVTLGLALDNGNVQVLTGVAEGEEVVTSGQFLLDSESKLKEAVEKMLSEKIGSKPAAEKPDKDDFFNDMQ
ncbi:MAG: efflux RND transporter periplasmic adaptor subunit [Proteobacteria bacterium]|nr:efflux RND transporter periplasmic adaptor subunit [Pseudomonadota bacterium]MBU1711377.1 efflux RND transporter periplasmic adaptor subunit [Pseudomonadota bacterium]